MNPIVFALRRPYTIVVGVLAIALASGLALLRTPVDIFPNLNVPVIYVAQPYGGMSPQQMEGYITNYFEYHFLYITGIEHVESRNIQGVALMKLYFHPGTDMAQAMAQVVGYVNRSRAFMPPGTVPPFIMRFDAGSVPVGYLVFSSETKTIAQIQDEALFRVRPLFASLPGVSAPPPFGGNNRTIILRANPERLRSYKMSPDEIVASLAANNAITPAGNLESGGLAPMVPVNSVVEDWRDLAKMPVRNGKDPVYVSDVARVIDGQDVTTCYGLVNGRRSVYILVTKRADASTLSVVNEVKKNLPRFKSALSEDIDVSFEFDQSPYVTRAIQGLGTEALLGALLTGLMVLLFLRDWRSVIVVVLNIPLALLGATFALWLSGQTINLMTLGGLALAVGILVDEATVEVENIHSQMDQTPSLARAVRQGNQQTAVPRLLAMLCILAVFIPSFFMEGAARALFVPLALAVGFAMITSYLLSSTLVPVLCVWLLRPTSSQQSPSHGHDSASGPPSRLQTTYAGLLAWTLRLRWLVLLAYAAVPVGLVAWWLLDHPGLGTEIFPQVDSGQFVLRLRAPDGTSLDATEALARDVLDEVARQAGGEDNVDITVGLVGTASYNYPINSIYLWSSGPQEAILRISLKRESGIDIDEFTERLRRVLPEMKRKKAPQVKDVRLSFEAGDIVSNVMSMGASAPIEVAIHGPSLPDNEKHAEKIRKELAKISSLRDLGYDQALAYPTIEVNVDRVKGGFNDVTAVDVGKALAPGTLSSRFTSANFWRDPKSGIAYQVQVELDPDLSNPLQQIKDLPVKGDIRIGDVAEVTRGKRPGQVDRYNMRRQLTLTANIAGEDLGRVADRVEKAIAAAGEPPRGAQVTLRGQVTPMRQMFRGLVIGLALAVVVIMLLLTAYFQSIRLALVVISTTPAVIAGVAGMLVLTGTTLNIQSFMGSIMAIGVAVANAILLATFAEQARRDGLPIVEAALQGARHRLRPILMTACAMLAGMLPLALGLGEGGEQTAPLGRAVVGGLAVATVATLLLLPAVFVVVQGGASRQSPSLDPDDTESAHFSPEKPVEAAP